MTTSPITNSEGNRLRELEKKIGKGQKTFVEVGLALAAIRDKRLYKEDYKTFQDYCRVRWGWDRRHANQMIEGAKVVKSLPEDLGTIVPKESHARALSAVPEDKREEVLTTAAESAKAEGKDVTARDIKEAAAELGFGPKKRKPKAEPPPPEPAPAEPPADDSDKRYAVALEDLRSLFLSLPADLQRSFLTWAREHTNS